LDKAAKEIGKNVVAVNCDVSKLEDLDHLYKEVSQAGKAKSTFSSQTRARSRPWRHPR
jgi:hypothetical protein